MTSSEKNVSITVHLPVRLDEIGYLGFVHPANYLKYMEHARVKLAEQQGLDLLDGTKKGFRVVVVNETINYRASATYGDVLAVTCWIEEIGNSSIKSGYRMVDQTTAREVLQATSTAVFIDPEGKPTPVPQEVRDTLSPPL